MRVKIIGNVHFYYEYLNKDISLNIHWKFKIRIYECHSYRSLSQIAYLGPCVHFMKSRKW